MIVHSACSRAIFGWIRSSSRVRDESFVVEKAYKAYIQHGHHPSSTQLIHNYSQLPSNPTQHNTQTNLHFTMNVFESPMYKATGFRLPLLPKIIMTTTAMVIGAAMVDRHVTPLVGYVDRRHWNQELVRLEVSSHNYCLLENNAHLRLTGSTPPWQPFQQSRQNPQKA